jgi:hypothetical protein
MALAAPMKLSVPHLDDNLAELSTFLTQHITNLTTLKNQLESSAHSSSPNDAAPAVNLPTYTNIADQFNVIVVTVSQINTLSLWTSMCIQENNRRRLLAVSSSVFCP